MYFCLVKFWTKDINFNVLGTWLENQEDSDRFNAEPGMLLGYENQCYNETDIVQHISANNFDSRNQFYLPGSVLIKQFKKFQPSKSVAIKRR